MSERVNERVNEVGFRVGSMYIYYVMCGILCCVCVCFVRKRTIVKPTGRDRERERIVREDRGGA